MRAGGGTIRTGQDFNAASSFIKSGVKNGAELILQLFGMFLVILLMKINFPISCY